MSQLPSTPAPKELKFTTIAILVGIMAAGTAIRLRVFDTGLGVDELLSLIITVGRGYSHDLLPRDEIMPWPGSMTSLDNAAPWWRIWPEQYRDTHPPFYFIILRFWREIFGEGDFSARFFSMLFSWAGMVLLFVMGRKLYDSATALWACALMAVSNPQIFIGWDARSYSMQVFMGLILICLIFRIERRGWSIWRGAFLFLLSLTFLLTHYFAVGLIAPLFVYALIRLPKPARWKVTGAIAASIVVFAILWGPTIIQQIPMMKHKNAWLIEKKKDHFAKTIGRIAVMPLKLMAEPMGKSQHEGEFGPEMLAAIIYLLPFLLYWQKRPDMLMWGLGLAGTIGIVAARDFGDPPTYQLYFTRYTVMAGPILFLMLSSVLYDRKGILKHIAPALALGYSLVTINTYPQVREDWRAYTSVIESQPVDLLVIASDDGGDWEGTILLALSHYSKNPPRRFVLLREPASPETLAEIRKAENITYPFGFTAVELAWYLPGAIDTGQPREFPYIGWLDYLHFDPPTTATSGPAPTSQPADPAR